MDGSSRTVLHSTGVPCVEGLTIDYDAQILYWIDNCNNRIESSYTNGTNRQHILSGSFSSHQLTFYDGVLYWIQTDYIYSASVSQLGSPYKTFYSVGHSSLSSFSPHVVFIAADRQPNGISFYL